MMRMASCKGKRVKVSPRLEVVHVKGRGHILGNGDVWGYIMADKVIGMREE